MFSKTFEFVRHFISGKPAYLYDDTDPDWLTTLDLGHTKKRSSSEASGRWARQDAAKALEAAEALVSLGDTRNCRHRQI